jgi:ABC-type cobalamin/Fe3+-siderophores transport system ATPase subunit
MSTTPWKFPGSRWWKFDFHTHTPKSTDAFKKTPCPDLKEWLLAFMRAEIDCVAVTDHNSGDALPDLQTALAGLQAAPPADFRPLTLFPGVEISVQGGVHILALFDPSRGRDDIIRLLEAVDFRGTPGDSDGVTHKSVTEVLEIIAGKGGLAIPAHVDEPKGLFVEIEGQSLLAPLKSEHVAAMELRDAAFKKPSLYTTEKVRWPEVLGSDTHNFAASGDQRFPGSHYTWVKMDTPTLAALRLALHDDNAFSLKRSDTCPPAYDPNTTPHLWIESLSVSNARLMGNGESAEFKFNPWMNAIIGGRGSGKSTLVHFLRLATKRDADLALGEGQPDNRVKANFDNFAQVGTGSQPGGLRPETVAELVIHKGEQRFLLRWQQADRGVTVSEWDATAESWKPASSQDVVTRFPVRLFSQEEIGVIAERPEALLRRVDESIGKAEWEARQRAVENQFIELVGRMRSLRARLADKDRLVGQREDLTKQLAAFEKSEHSKIRQSFQKRSRQQREIDALLESFRALAARIGQFKDDLLLHDLPAGLIEPADPVDQALSESDARLRQTLAKAVEMLAGLETEMRSQADATEAALAASCWSTAVKEAVQEHEALIVSLKVQGVSDPAAYAHLVARRQVVEKELKEIEGTETEITRLTEQSQACLERLVSLRNELRERREAFLTTELHGNRYVKISLIPFGHEGAKDQIEAEIRRDLQCQDTRFASAIRSRDDGVGFVEKLYQNLPADEAARTQTVLGRIQEFKHQVSQAASGQPHTLGGHFGNFLSGKFKDRPEGLDRFRLWWPEDSLVVSYSRTGDGQNFVSLSSGSSAGEKAAALLAFFLAHGDTPLIIDQPENDLDNHLITDLIVTQLKNNKERRQIIVVTHNPNIVVNGDAELVHALEFKRGQCRAKVSGALQDEKVRAEVCAVMEGGRTALKSRFERLI